MASQSGKKEGSRRSPSKNSNSSSPAASFRNEVILWVVFAFSIILFISNFGIAGKAGNFISSVFFGLFGLIAYIFPFLLFAGTAFLISNKDNTIAVVKVAAAVVFTIFLCFFLELIGGDALMENPLDAYAWSAERKYGGGLFGGILTWLIRPNLGVVSAYVIDIIVMIICVVLITERSMWKPIAFGSRKVYDTAKNETIRQRRQYEERKARRMDNKVVGVSTDTSIREPVKPANSDAIGELHPDPVFAQSFPIQINGQTVTKSEQPSSNMIEFPVNVPNYMEPQVQRHAVAESPVPYAMAERAIEPVKSPLDDIVPIMSQKVVLQPNLPVEEEPVKPQTPAKEADDLLAKTSDLFSELLPDFDHSMSGAAEQETIVSDKPIDAADAGYEAFPETESGPEAAYNIADSYYESDYESSADTNSVNGMETADIFSDSGSNQTPDIYSAMVMENTADALSGTDMDASEDLLYPADAAIDIGTASMNRLTDDLSYTEPDSVEEYQEPEEALRQLAEPVARPAQAAVSPSRREKAPSGDDTHTETLHNKPREGTSSVKAEAVDIQIQVPQTPVKREYIYPPFEMLKAGDPTQTGDSKQHLQETALKLQQTLKNFGVNVTILNVSCGPSVTRYEIQPEMGVKVSKIVNLADDIKLNLAAADIRIEAPIPGKAAIGIEVPNKETVMVNFRDLLEADEFRQSKSSCTFAVGKDIAGKVIVTDICKMPHLLIAGATGSGKSVCINTIIMSIIYKAKPEDVKLIMIDPKVVELSVYNGLPHLLLPVVTDPKKAAGALHWAVSEMMDRYQKFAGCGVRDIKGYNAKIKQLETVSSADKPEKMPYIVIIVDELADLMMVAPGDVEDAICRLAQLARAAGIHLIIATQRPSVNVITGLIKANMPSRIAFSVTSGTDSRTILDMNGAEKLLGKGDMLFYPQGIQKPLRVQGAFISDGEISKVMDYLVERNGAPQYDPDVAQKVSDSTAGSATVSIDSDTSDDRDAYFSDAARLLMDKEKASVSMLQRYFKIGFNRAARIMDQLEEAGVVGPEEGTKPRKILMSPEEFEQYEEEYL